MGVDLGRWMCKGFVGYWCVKGNGWEALGVDVEGYVGGGC
jgi:hypothetical protein